jgi:hypothetical protein
VYIKGKNFSTVFILGAGATRGAIRHVILNRKRVKPPLNSDFFKIALTYAQAQGKNAADNRRLKRLNLFFRDYLPTKRDNLSMETAFSLLFMAKDFPKIYAAERGRRHETGDRPEIEDFLRLAFGIFTILDRSSNGETGYDRLANVLGTQDTLITLNYDTLLDSALARRGWNPISGYCLGGGKRKVNWVPKRISSNIDLTHVNLLKLHGSINWFVRGSFSDLSAIFSKKPARVENPRKNEMRGYIRQIVPPIYGKFFGHDHWRNLWLKAYRSLCESELLVVIGCSLVETDFHLRALLSRVSKWRKNRNELFKRVIFVDRAGVRRKWARALKGSYSKVSSYPNFEVFLSKELRI